MSAELATPTPLEAFTQSPANQDAALQLLREALNAPSREDVEKIVADKLLNLDYNKRIELQTGDIITKLEEVPRHKLFPEILEAVYAGLNVALIGPAGSGKSTVCGQIAKALGLKYYLQNGVTGTHELTGYMDAYGKYNGTPFRSAYEHGGFIMFDEVDTSDASALKWVNTAIANGYAVFPDNPETISMHKEFRIVMGANTFGTGADRVYVGANQLDASTLDRFVFFNFDYDEELETLLSGNAEWAKRVQELRKAAMAEKARIVISPRATLHGAKLLNIGWSQETVEERVIWKGIDPEMKERIVKRIDEIKKDAISKRIEEEFKTKQNPFKKKR